MKSTFFIFQAILIIIITVSYSVTVMICMVLLWSKKIFFPMCRSWSRALLFVSGIKVIVDKKNEKDIVGTSCVYVVNHASLFDIPVLIGYLPDNVRIMYKRELRKIPIMGWALASSPYIPITRTDARDAMRSINDSIAAIKDGESVIVFAEGTRSKDGTLGEFKRGAFMVAARSGKPIVPVTLIGTSGILPKKSLYFNSGTVRMIVNNSIQLSDNPDKQEENNAKDLVHGIIEGNLMNNP